MTTNTTTTKTFPPLKKLHSNIGFQMVALESAIGGEPPSVRRKVRRISTSLSKKRSMSLAMELRKSPSPRSSFSSKATSDVKEDRDALTLALQEIQIILMQSKSSSSSQRKKSATVAGSCTSRTSLTNAEYTLFLPNFMWFQPIAIHRTTNMIRPTSLCSGTGITGGSQYLQPEMMKMFSVFGSYLNGSGHLFNTDDIAAKNQRRRAFWVDTIDENDDEFDSEVADDNDHGSNSRSDNLTCTDDDDDDDDGTIGSDIYDSLCMTQDELIEMVIIDLRRSQMMA